VALAAFELGPRLFAASRAVTTYVYEVFPARPVSLKVVPGAVAIVA
jgi:hypothetical protein